MYIYKYVFICTSMCIYVCTCVCTYIYIHLSHRTSVVLVPRTGNIQGLMIFEVDVFLAPTLLASLACVCMDVCCVCVCLCVCACEPMCLGVRVCVACAHVRPFFSLVHEHDVCSCEIMWMRGFKSENAHARGREREKERRIGRH